MNKVINNYIEEENEQLLLLFFKGTHHTCTTTSIVVYSIYSIQSAFAESAFAGMLLRIFVVSHFHRFHQKWSVILGNFSHVKNKMLSVFLKNG